MRFETPLDYYQAIANELVEIFPRPWASVRVDAERFTDSINLKIVYTCPQGSRESNVDAIMLPEYFHELAEAISTKEKGLYKKCVFTLTANGKFDVSFEY
jgi:hypothetical protein